MGAAAVLVCALELLGGSVTTARITLLASRPADVSVVADGFVRSGDPTIYILTSSAAFRQADCLNRASLLKLASVIAHEDWHQRYGDDERGAYDAQLRTLLRLGAALDSPVYRGVLRSMQAALKEGPRRANPPRETVLAAAATGRSH